MNDKVKNNIVGVINNLALKDEVLLRRGIKNG
jgi:hypothetical protein